jgi:hypothetical protein
MNPTNPNEDGLTFAQWNAKVDAVLLSLCGLDSGCLADAPYYDMWNDSVPVAEAAHEVLVEWNDYPEDLLGEGF